MDDNNDLGEGTVMVQTCRKCDEAIIGDHNCTPHLNPETGLPWGLKISSKAPKKNCKKCYGRGHLGWIDGDKEKPYPCMCTVEIIIDVPAPKTVIPTGPIGTTNEQPPQTPSA